MQGLKFISTGRYLPEKIVTNYDMSNIVDTSDEWISSRTGIRSRHFCEKESGVSMAAAAARKALEKSKIKIEDIGVCIVATVAADFIAPTTACLLQRELGLPENITAFDMNVGCTGFMYGLNVMRGLLMQSKKPYGIIVASEVLSRITDFTDRSTCVLFGDGAAAAIVTLENDSLYYSTTGCKGDKAIWGYGAGSQDTYLHMDGPMVFRFAVDVLPRCVNDLLRISEMSADDISWIIPHQANRRIIEAAAKRLKMPIEKFYINLENYGNTSAASIPIALDEMGEKGILKNGQKIIMAGFGAGLTWGGVLTEW